MKCPDCGQYSLTFDLIRWGFVCHVYNGFIPVEDAQHLGTDGWVLLGYVNT